MAFIPQKQVRRHLVPRLLLFEMGELTGRFARPVRSVSGHTNLATTTLQSAYQSDVETFYHPLCSGHGQHGQFLNKLNSFGRLNRSSYPNTWCNVAVSLASCQQDKHDLAPRIGTTFAVHESKQVARCQSKNSACKRPQFGEREPPAITFQRPRGTRSRSSLAVSPVVVGQHQRLPRTGAGSLAMKEAAESVRKAASFLFIASENAQEGPRAAVKKAAVTLHDLHRRVAMAEIESADELTAVFIRAHLAMSQHHAAKAADAFANKKWALAGNYLRSSANHLQRASYWAAAALQSGS